MTNFPEIGTFDVLGHGSDYGNLQAENGQLKKEKLLLMILLTIIVIGGVIYIKNEQIKKKGFEFEKR